MHKYDAYYTYSVDFYDVFLGALYQSVNACP